MYDSTEETLRKKKAGFQWKASWLKKCLCFTDRRGSQSMLSVRFSCLYLLLVRQVLPKVEMKFEFFPSAHSKLEMLKNFLYQWIAWNTHTCHLCSPLVLLRFHRQSSGEGIKVSQRHTRTYCEVFLFIYWQFQFFIPWCSNRLSLMLQRCVSCLE